jgi:hypothetical protein
VPARSGRARPRPTVLLDDTLWGWGERHPGTHVAAAASLDTVVERWHALPTAALEVVMAENTRMWTIQTLDPDRRYKLAVELEETKRQIGIAQVKDDGERRRRVCSRHPSRGGERVPNCHSGCLVRFGGPSVGSMGRPLRSDPPRGGHPGGAGGAGRGQGPRRGGGRGASGGVRAPVAPRGATLGSTLPRRGGGATT